MIHTKLKQNGINFEHRESDLHVPYSEKALNIIKSYPYAYKNHTTFISEIDGTKWIEIPFGYTPFFDK